MRDETYSIFSSETISEEENRYFRMIDYAMGKRENSIISNGKPGHAVYLIHKLLENAKNTVKIYTGNLSRTFNGIYAYADPEIANSAIRFLRRENSKLSILVADDIDVDEKELASDHPFISAIKNAEDIKGSLDVQSASAEKLMYHFIVMDEEAYRIEIDPINAKAFVNFGDEVYAQKLSNIFDKLKQGSKPLIQ